MSDLTTLIDDLSNATGPDRELDARIAVAVFQAPKDPEDLVSARMPHKYDRGIPGTYWISRRSGLSSRTAPRYTGSMDDALTLVPADMVWRCEQRCRPRNPLRNFGLCVAHVWDWAETTEYSGQHDSPRIALVIASLRAVETMRERES